MKVLVLLLIYASICFGILACKTKREQYFLDKGVYALDITHKDGSCEWIVYQQETIFPPKIVNGELHVFIPSTDGEEIYPLIVSYNVQSANVIPRK